MGQMVGQLFFNDTTLAEGFSEQYWLSGADYASANTNLVTIAAARLATICTDVKLVGARVSDSTIRGDVYPNTVALGAGTWVTGTDVSSELWNALVVKQTNASFFNSNRFMHAIPSLQIQGQGFNPTMAWQTVVTAYFNAIKANSMYRQKRGGAPVSYVAITNVNTNHLTSKKVGRPFFLTHARREIS